MYSLFPSILSLTKKISLLPKKKLSALSANAIDYQNSFWRINFFSRFIFSLGYFLWVSDCLLCASGDLLYSLEWKGHWSYNLWISKYMSSCRNTLQVQVTLKLWFIYMIRWKYVTMHGLCDTRWILVCFLFILILKIWWIFQQL